MSFFKDFTPISYWLLIILWLFIFGFYVDRIRKRRLKSKLFITLLIILAIDAFRTLFESVYFGMWYTSLVGFLPESVHSFLVRPELVFIPKIINIVAALLVIAIVIKRWIPEEEKERDKERKHLSTLEREIEEKEQAQQLLFESEKRLVEAQKLAKMGHYVLDVESSRWSSSSELDALLGIDKEYPKNIEGWLQLVHPDYRSVMLSYLQTAVLSKNQKFNKEYKIVRAKDKQELWVHGVGNLKFDAEGTLLEMFGTIQDITERKHLDDLLKASKEKLQNLIQNIQAAVIVHGADTKITNCNKVSLEITGLTQDQILGKDAMDPSWKIFSADGTRLSQDEYPVNKVLHSKTVLRNMLVGIYRPETNDTVKVLVNAVPIFDVVGNVSEVIVTFMDITERIKIENEREKLLESLQIALDEIKTLKGVIPICSNCKKIRDDTGYWNQLESYIQKYSDAAFSHGICPECVEELYGKQDWYKGNK